MVTTTAYPKDLQALLDTMPDDLTPNDSLLIERAYHKAEKAHERQTRKSGEPYFTHCVAVAGILADMKMDAETVSAGLLHDIIEDTETSEDEIKTEFGQDIARLVVGVTKLTKLPIKQFDNLPNQSKQTSNNQKMEYFRKMFLTMDDDVRVVIVKLADRLHNMRTLGYMPEEKQKRIARETMDIFAPLANRLGIWQIKWELEDLSFRYLNNEAYRTIAKSLDERRASREEYINNVAQLLRDELERENIRNVYISGRPKHIYSIYRKMSRKELPLEQIYDVRALRVIVQEESQCYPVLGIVHRLWRPIPGEFDDYIAAPKENFYRSLHTAVIDNRGKTLEVQIRSWDMHEDAEYGIAAHWRYKEGRKGAHDRAFEDRIAYLRRLMEFGSAGREEDAETFMSRVKSEVFEDRVYAFTPKGDIIDLPAGATPIDFAYSIHTEIGHRCRGAKVHGKLKPLNYQLRMGDQVDIVTAKRGGPSMDWLNSDLGYVKTHRARSKIRHYFRRQNREKHIQLGREVLERELKRLGVLDKMTFEHVAHLIGYERVEDFLAGIGVGDITGSHIAQRVLEEERQRDHAQKTELERIQARPRKVAVDDSNGVKILGTGGLLVNMARCCSPAAGDDIIGYVTRGRGVTVHRQDCANVAAIQDTERLIGVSWGSVAEEQKYVVPVEVIAQDREGLLKDIATLMSDERINIADINVNTRQQVATLYFRLEIADNQQLTRIINKIEQVNSVFEAHRVNQT